MTPYDAPPQVPVELMSDDALLAAVTARGENSGQSTSSPGIFFLMAALFLALGGLRWGWQAVVFLAIAIAVHELGHVIAMRLFGYKNVRMLFIPLLGGLATGEPRELNATKNALVALAGPAVGLVSAALAGVLAVFVGSPPWLVGFAWISLVLNAFNLLPFVPLDGGQFTNDTLFSRHPAMELIFRFVAIACLGWLAWNDRNWLLGAVMFFLLITAQINYQRASLIRDLRRDPAWQTRALDREAVAVLREKVTKLFHTVPRQKLDKQMPGHVQGMWLEIHKRFPGIGHTLALLGGYAFLCVIVVPAIAFFLMQFLPRQEH